MILESEYFEDENEDLLVIETMKRVKCKVLQKGYKQTTMYYYICSCDPKQKRPICEECAVVCHAGHTLSEKYMGDQVCSCGKKNHRVSETPKEGNPYDPKCVFNEFSKNSKLNIYYTNGKTTACLFCKNVCFNEIDENEWKTEVNENLPECSCQGHPNPKNIYQNITDITRTFKIELLSNTHLLNLIFLSPNVFDKYFNCLKNFINKFSKQPTSKFMFDPNIKLSYQYSALSTLSNIANNTHFQNYYQKSVKEMFSVDKLYKLLEISFNDDSVPIWILKNNFICCFENIVFLSDLIVLPEFKISDFSNFSPFQRIIFNKYIQTHTDIVPNYINSPKNLINEFLSSINNLIYSKNFNIVGYDILFRLLNILKDFAKYNLFKVDQQNKYFFLIDNILYFFNNMSKQIDIESGLIKEIRAKEMLILECICKSLLYMSFNYNDSLIQSLVEDGKKPEEIKFFHLKNPIAKGITRNCIQILNYTKNCFSHKNKNYDDVPFLIETPKENSTPRERRLSVYKDCFERDTKEATKNILSRSTQIISLCLNNPDVYIIGLKRLLNNPDLVFYSKVLKNDLLPNEKTFVEFINSSRKEIESDIFSFFNFRISIKDLINNTINNIASIFSKNNINYTFPQIDLNYDFIVTENHKKNEKFLKIRNSSVSSYKKYRILMNQSPYIHSIIKVLSVFNKFTFDSQEERNELELKLIDSIFKIFYFYVEDNPDNCITILSKKFLNELLKINDLYIEKILSFQYYCLKWIALNEVEVDDVMLWEKFAYKLYEKSLSNEDQYNCLLLLMKIYKMFILDISSLTHSALVKKIRKSILGVLHRSKLIKQYFSLTIDKEVFQSKLDENILIKSSRDNEADKMSKIFYKFMRILNIVFDENVLYNNLFLSRYLKKEDIRTALRYEKLNIKIRTELLRFYRLVYMDVKIDQNKIPLYISEFCSQLQDNSESQILNIEKLKKYIFMEKLINSSDELVYDHVGIDILIYELTNFNLIIEQSHVNNSSAKSLYIEQGIIQTLRVFFNKIFCISHKMPGKQFIKVYELIILFLNLKLFICTNQFIQNSEETMKKSNLLKSIKRIKLNKDIINWKRTSMNDIEMIEKDIKKMSDFSFEALDYVACYEIVCRHFFDFINKQQSKNLKEFYGSNNSSFKKEEIEELTKNYQHQIEKDLLRIIEFYEKTKSEFDECSLVENLDDMHVYYKKNYRNLLIQFLFYLFQNEELDEEYFSHNSSTLILKLLEKDYKKVQKELYLLLEENELKLEIYIEIFFKQVLSVIFTNFNPSALDFHFDYKTSCTILKIFYYMCEEQNKQFQDIILNKLEIEIPSKKLKVKKSSKNFHLLSKDGGERSSLIKCKKIRFYHFLIYILDKIILLSDWAQRNNNHEDVDLSYFYDLFSCIVDLLIVTIQGTEPQNFEIFLRKNKNRNIIIEHEYIIKKDKDEDSYLHSLHYFLKRGRELLYNEDNNSNIMYNVKTDITSLLLAFLEEKQCHIEIKNLIIHTYYPKNIMSPIIKTLRNYLISYLTKGISNNRQEMIECNSFLKLNKTNFDILKDLYIGQDLSNSLEFNYANILYRYIKLLALQFDNAEALSILEMGKDKEEKPIEGSLEEEYYYAKEFFETITKSIWVKLSTEENTRVIFTVHPLIFHLSENSKRAFLDEVPREDRYTKLYSLLTAKKIFIDEIIYNFKNLRTNRFLKWLSNFNFYWAGVTTFFYCFAINIFMTSVLTEDLLKDFDNSNHKSILFGLHVSMVILTGIFIIIWIYGKFILYFIKDRSYYIKQKKSEYELTTWSLFNIGIFYTILGRAEILQLFWILVWSILGIFYKFYFCNSIALLSVIGLSETLINIVRAVKIKWKELIATMLFVLIVIYIYANIGYFKFYEDFEKGSENLCENLRFCYLTHLLEGLRRHGGVGDVMVKVSWVDKPGHFISRFLFDFLFFIMVVVILLNVVFGIIIDTFRELRLEQQKNDNDRMTVCFICGMNKDELERKNIKFEQHIGEEHNVWNYMYYMIGLDLASLHNLNAINMEMFEKIRNMDISWVPSAEGSLEQE